MACEIRNRPSVASTIEDLANARTRLDKALHWLRDGHATTATVALAQEVRFLCEGALLSNEPRAVESLLADVKERLEELERLLRRH